MFLRGPEVECQRQLPINLLVPSFSLLAGCRVISESVKLGFLTGSCPAADDLGEVRELAILLADEYLARV